jgi:hypothetical protein
MGFNKRFVVLEHCIKALENNDLKSYYGKSDMLVFEDKVSSKIHQLYLEGKSESEILINIKPNMEEKTYEVY